MHRIAMLVNRILACALAATLASGCAVELVEEDRRRADAMHEDLVAWREQVAELTAELRALRESVETRVPEDAGDSIERVAAAWERHNDLLANFLGE